MIIIIMIIIIFASSTTIVVALLLEGINTPLIIPLMTMSQSKVIKIIQFHNDEDDHDNPVLLIDDSQLNCHPLLAGHQR